MARGGVVNGFDGVPMPCVMRTGKPPPPKEPDLVPDAPPDAPPRPRQRDAEGTKARILEAAKREFARGGMGGARVDVIAEKARANKRMIYHYFGSKEGLFQTVLEHAYVDIRSAEQKLNLDHLAPGAALERLVRFTWDYYLKNPEFITLVNSENLHRARHLTNSEVIKVVSRIPCASGTRPRRSDVRARRSCGGN